MPKTAFSLRLKELRAQAGLTQAELAEKADINKDSVVQLEGGRYAPSWETVQALCDALGVGCEAFRLPPSPETKPVGRGRPKKAAE